ncbi:MAG: SPOR domain-containing protein [Terracidiphilus sp.]
MRGVFVDKANEEPKLRSDTELTLGAGTLLLIFFGLALVCGLCFGLGYTVGHRGGQSTTAAGQQPAAGSPTSAQGSASPLKPSAMAQTAAPTAAQSGQQPVATGLPQSAAAAVVPIVGQQNSNPAPAQSTTSAQPQVRPALPPVETATQTLSASSAQPVAPRAASLMVQIAAVSHEEDASVLVGALRKRGYAVDARRDPADNLIHVRIGPFNDRNEANRWRLKLLNDGYNAMIQP